MKKIIIISIALLALISCHKVDYSYLNIKAINYPQNNMTVVIGLTDADTIKPANAGPGGPGGGFPGFPGGPGGGFPGAGPQASQYKARIKNKSPWVSLPFWGGTVEGARPFTVTVESVKTEGEKANADILKSEIKIFGEGAIHLPYQPKTPVGKYILSLRIANIHGSDVAEDIFTVIVTDKKWD